MTAFLVALASGDPLATAAACSPGIMQFSDGGGVVRAATHPIVGVNRVVRFNHNLNARYAGRAAAAVVLANGRLGLRVTVDDTLSFLDMFGVCRNTDGRVRVHRVWRLLEPTKLASAHAPSKAWR